MTKADRYFPQLTGIRAIAAYLVYLFHVTFPIGVVLQREFHIGVGIFFVLSGFLIYYRYFGSFQATKVWWAGYVKNRIARIYPLYFLLTILVLLVKGSTPRDWLLNLTFAKGFFDQFKFLGIAQGWSLTVEECFYFSAPFIFLMFRRRKFWLPLVGIYAIGILLTLMSQGLSLPYEFFGSFRFTLVNTFFGRAFEFFVGMYLARIFLNYTKTHAPPIGENKGRVTWIGLLGIALLVIWMASFQTPTELGLNHPVGIVINNLLLPIAYGLLFWGLLTEQTLLKRLLASNLMVLLGKASYGFYLIHVGVIQQFVSDLGVRLGLNYFVHYVYMFFAINLIAVGLFLFVEEPLNRWIRKSRLLVTAPRVDLVQAAGTNASNPDAE